MPLPSKRSLFEAALEPGAHVGTVLLCFREHPGVLLPADVADAHFAASPPRHCSLRYSYGFGIAIEVSDDGVAADLSFNHVDHPTFVPWEAVVGIVEEQSGTVVQFGQHAPQPKPKGGLRLVKE